MSRILTLGANGQLGLMFQEMSTSYPEHDFLFADKNTCDITDLNSIDNILEQYRPDIILNCAAYTAVDQAETDKEKAYQINATAVKHLAAASKNQNALLVHFSSDYVYHLDTDRPLRETEDCRPVGVYAKSKKQGEDFLMESGCEYLIVRTSWLYSEYGHNFVKTMLRLAESRNELSIVNDQIGCPTYTRDLVEATMTLIASGKKNEIYNFANAGQISWYDFAKEIFAQKGIDMTLHPIPTSAYPTPSQRPSWSLLNLSKIVHDTGIEIKNWQSSLKETLSRI